MELTQALRVGNGGHWARRGSNSGRAQPKRNPPAANDPGSEVRDRAEAVVALGRATAAMDKKYGSLFRELALSEEQTLELRNLLAEREMVLRSAWMSLRQEGLSFREAWSNGLADQASATEQSIQALLTSDQYGQLEAYEQTLGVRNSVDGLAASLSGSQFALDEKTTETLVQTLTRLETPNQIANQTHYNLLFEGGAPISPAALKLAVAVFSPGQADAVAEAAELQTESKELRKMVATPPRR
ncbi:MAG TPA: hypothetical protein VGL42_03830 [Opitutaceae bacterium]